MGDFEDRVARYAGVGTPLKKPKWEAFCVAYVLEGGDASAAYRRVYPAAERWKDESVWTRASRILNHAKVLPRVREIQAHVTGEGVASAEEVARVLTSVVRGEMRQPLLGRDGVPVVNPLTGQEVTVPPLTRERIAACRGLADMLGYRKPVKVEVTGPAEGGAGFVPGHVAGMSDEELARAAGVRAGT